MRILHITNVLFIFLVFMGGAALPARAETDIVYKRVIDSKTIRCGYAQWPPFFSTDPNTKAPQGLNKELMEKIGAKLGLKVEWTTEIGWGEVTEAIKSNKFDVFCVGVWPTAPRMRLMTLSRPMMYNPAYLFTRADDRRFDHHYERVNSPDVTLTGTSGSVVEEISDTYFPAAKKAYISPGAQDAEVFMSILSKKADVVAYNTEGAEAFLKNDPGTLRRVEGPPIALYQLSLPLSQGEYQLKNMIDTVLTDFINDGTIAALIKKYNAKDTYAPRPDVEIPQKKVP